MSGDGAAVFVLPSEHQSPEASMKAARRRMSNRAVALGQSYLANCFVCFP